VSVIAPGDLLKWWFRGNCLRGVQILRTAPRSWIQFRMTVLVVVGRISPPPSRGS